jgi:peptide deformylase
MVLLEILPDTDPLMRKTCKRIRKVDNELRQLVDDMYETMVDGWGIGLAAIQVGVRKRLFIYEIPKREIRGYETCPPDPDVDTGEEVENTPEPDPEPGPSDTEEEESGPYAGYTGDYTVCINPRITAREGKVIDEEGCLSKSGWVAKVERDYRVTFQAFDINMKKFERTVEGMEARCVQHEIDHLDGILFTDRCQAGTLREVTAEELEEDEEGTEADAEVTEESEAAVELEDSTVAGD